MGNCFEISFESFPLEFLLVYCDLIQEWGRTKKTTEGKYDSKNSPKLERLEIINEKVLCTLNYDPTVNHPAKDILNNYVNKIKQNFISEISFEVKYKFPNEEDLDVRTCQKY